MNVKYMFAVFAFVVATIILLTLSNRIWTGGQVNTDVTIISDDVVGATGALRGSLLRMGFEEIVIEDCTISFGRSVRPTLANNGFKYMEFIVHLGSINWEEYDGPLERSIGGMQFYETVWGYAESYERVQEATRKFRRAFRSNPSFSSWPPESPISHSSEMYVIEQAFRETDLYERTVARFDHSQHGVFRIPLVEFYLTHDDPDVLVSIGDAFRTLSSSNDC